MCCYSECLAEITARLLEVGDQRKTLKHLMIQRHPIYSQADITVNSGNEPPGTTVQKVYEALRQLCLAR